MNQLDYRKIKVSNITDIIEKLCVEACTDLDKNVRQTLTNSINKESTVLGKSILKKIVKNAELGSKERIPICQDTGYVVIFLEIGQQITFTGGFINDAVNEGIKRAYVNSYLRKSIIKNPITNPQNSEDNTPGIIHTEIVPGAQLKITVMPKGGGSENMSRVKMLSPSDGIVGAKQFVIDTVKTAGANPCPPIIVGVGIGGTFDYVTLLSKKALLRDIGNRHPDNTIAKLEQEWLDEINQLNIGPAGLKGDVTALDLFIETYPRHIASFPVAVNIQCHAARKKTAII